MDPCAMRPSFVSTTVARFHKRASYLLYRGCLHRSTPYQAVAGLARQAQHESLQEQQQQQQQQPSQLASHTRHVPVTALDREPTGAFARLPMVPISSELIESALKRAAKMSGSKKVKNEAQKARSKAASQMDTLTKEVCVPLGKYMKGFPAVHRLHPFETAMLELTWGTARYEQALARVDSLRKSILQMGKGYAGQANKAGHKAEAAAICEEGFKQVESVYLKSARAVDDLKQVAQNLRRLPVVDPLQPVVALVGAPNVGKSSLVNVLSSGVPEVCDYPFTTRSVKMGHFFIDGHRHQVTDTPGLLNRPLAERNAMEKLTLACLQHLPSTVLFVLDLTAQCGTSVADQLAIRQTLLTDFPGKLWLDVLSKADLLESDFKAADAARHTQTGPENSTSMQDGQQESMQAQTVVDGQQMSATAEQHAGSNLQHQQPVDCNLEVHNSAQAAGEVSRGADAHVSGPPLSEALSVTQNASRGVLAHQQTDDSQALHMADENLSTFQQQQSGHDERAASVEASAVLSHASLSVAAQAALTLPNAIRISSVTQSGIQQLQVNVTNLLAKRLEAREQ